MRSVGVGLLGAGTVGAALGELLVGHGPTIAERSGVELRLRRVAVRRTAQPRGDAIPAELIVGDPFQVVDDPEVDVVVELMGGIDPAEALLRRALGLGKPVVTANKALLAHSGPELFALAADSGVELLFEAAVGGAVPLVRPLRETLAGERIRRVVGIVNGTTNFVLGEMAERGLTLEEAVEEARRRGYAEADPAADLDGDDAAAKAAILAGLAFGVDVRGHEVEREGIGGLIPTDLAWARRAGYEVKLLAVLEQPGRRDDRLAVRVAPMLVPRAHPLASVRAAHNAVFIEGDAVGEIMLYGPGAGGAPTAAAVLGDLIDAAQNLAGHVASRLGPLRRVALVGPAERQARHYLRVEVTDRPGVLAQVASVFGDNGVSIQSMEQEGLGDRARLVFLTHRVGEANLVDTAVALSKLDAVRRVGSLLPLFETETQDSSSSPLPADRRIGR